MAIELHTPDQTHRGRSRSRSPRSGRSSTLVDVEETSSRTKAPAHWIRTLQPGQLLTGKNYTNFFKYARACVNRVQASDPDSATQLQQRSLSMNACIDFLASLVDPESDFQVLKKKFKAIAKSVSGGVPESILQLYLGRYIQVRTEEVVQNFPNDAHEAVAVKFAASIDAVADSGHPFEVETPAVSQLALPQNVIFTISGKILMCDCLKTLLRRGGSTQDVVLYLVLQVNTMYSKVLRNFEAVPEPLKMIVQLCRGIVAVIRPNNATADFNAVATMELDFRAGKETLLADFRIAIESTSGPRLAGEHDDAMMERYFYNTRMRT